MVWNVSGNRDRPASEGRFINSSILAVYHNEARYYGSCLALRFAVTLLCRDLHLSFIKNTRVDRQPLEMRSCIILTSQSIIADITSSPECETSTVHLKSTPVKEEEDKHTSNTDTLTFIALIWPRWDPKQASFTGGSILQNQMQR